MGGDTSVAEWWERRNDRRTAGRNPLLTSADRRGRTAYGNRSAELQHATTRGTRSPSATRRLIRGLPTVSPSGGALMAKKGPTG